MMECLGCVILMRTRRLRILSDLPAAAGCGGPIAVCCIVSDLTGFDDRIAVGPDSMIGSLAAAAAQARRLRIMLVVTAVLELGDIVTDCLWVNQLLTMYSARPPTQYSSAPHNVPAPHAIIFGLSCCCCRWLAG